MEGGRLTAETAGIQVVALGDAHGVHGRLSELRCVLAHIDELGSADGNAPRAVPVVVLVHVRPRTVVVGGYEVLGRRVDAQAEHRVGRRLLNGY